MEIERESDNVTLLLQKEKLQRQQEYARQIHQKNREHAAAQPLRPKTYTLDDDEENEELMHRRKLVSVHRDDILDLS